MRKPKKVWEKVYQIGGPDISHAQDCMIFLVDIGNKESVMIDCGAGNSIDTLIRNMQSIGLDPSDLKALILTHCHIDHIGAAREFKEKFNVPIVAHRDDVDGIEGRNLTKTAARWYGVDYKPVTVDNILSENQEIITFGDVKFNCIHTPGHTPGSISVYCDIEGKRILFGQDIHGPFNSDFGSDKEKWRKSMEKLINLKADILCEGHFGVYTPRERVRGYIEGYLRRY